MSEKNDATFEAALQALTGAITTWEQEVGDLNTRIEKARLLAHEMRLLLGKSSVRVVKVKSKKKKKATPKKKVKASGKCGCGRPSNHGGRCHVRRKNDGKGKKKANSISQEIIDKVNSKSRQTQKSE